MKCIKQNITNKTLYTKHFYAESQRLASKLGAGLASSIVDPTQFQVTEVCSSYEEKSDSLLQMLARGWDCAEIEPGNVSIENPELQVINDLAEVSADEPESDIYYYHTDHLGSSSWITDAGGDVNQHLQYLPFGEDYIYQRNTSWNIPYTFSGKEKDAETGYSYFGARYYDSDISVWLSVDPLSDKRPNLSPYNYCQWNPIMRIDPEGLTDFTFNKKTGEVKRIGEKNNKPDRILKTNRKGEVKYKRNGEAKVAVSDIEQGILKNGQNFKNNDQIINVGGDRQPSVEGVKSFTLKLSEYLKKEIKGFSYSSDGSGSVTHMVLGKYLNNTFTSSRGTTLSLQKKFGKKFSLNNIVQQYHTHPNGNLGATKHAPEQSEDVKNLQNDKPFLPNASFIILYRISGQNKPAEYDYTHEYKPTAE